jgi:hypothetical protein
MPRRKARQRLPHSVYLAFFSAVHPIVKAAGFEAFPEGGLFTRQELERMDEACERGDSVESFATWLVVKRAEEASRELALSSEMMGNETISPSEVAA